MKRSASIINVAFLFLFLPFAVGAQIPPTNHKPVFHYRVPSVFLPHQVNVAYQFLVGASDPDGDTLTYTWRLGRVLVQSGYDSTYTLFYTDSLIWLSGLTCVFSDPGGLKDSTKWSFGDPVLPHVEPRSVPREYALNQNSPNPFNPSTTISYQLPRPSAVRITVFNLLGQLVAILVDQNKQAGFHRIEWKPELPSGIYICRLEAGSYMESRKMLLTK